MFTAIIAIAVIFLLLFLIGIYLKKRLILPLRQSKKVNLILSALLFTLIFVSFTGTIIVYFKNIPVFFVNGLLSSQFYCLFILGFLSNLLTLIVIEHTVIFSLERLFYLFNHSGLFKNSCPIRDTMQLLLHRFLLLRKPISLKTSRIIIASLAVIMSGYGYYLSRNPSVNKIIAPISRLPIELTGIKIAILSDLHIGPDYDKNFVDKISEQVQQLNPDILVLIGDIADGLASKTETQLNSLKNISTPYGKYYVTGNHEYYWEADEWVTAVRNLGFTPLINEHVLIQKGMAVLVLGGIPDPRGHQILSNTSKHTIDLNKTFAGTPTDRNSFRVLLSHNPNTIHDASKANVQLQISGHTHGGQFFPWNFVVHLVQKYVAGFYNVNGTQLFITKGTAGWGPPNRLGARGEIVLLVLDSI